MQHLRPTSKRSPDAEDQPDRYDNDGGIIFGHDANAYPVKSH